MCDLWPFVLVDSVVLGDLVSSVYATASTSRAEWVVMILDLDVSVIACQCKDHTHIFNPHAAVLENLEAHGTEYLQQSIIHTLKVIAG